MCQILTIFPVLRVELGTSNILTKFFDTKLIPSLLFDFYVGTKNLPKFLKLTLNALLLSKQVLKLTCLGLLS